MMHSVESTRVSNIHTPQIAPARQSEPGHRRVLGVRVDDVTLDEIMRVIADSVADRHRCHIVTLNSEYVMHARKTDELRQIIETAAVVTADGAGITQAARMMRLPLRARITGNDLTAALSDAGVSLFLLGAAPGVADEAAAVLRQRHPNVRIAGIWAGSADALDDVDIRARISATDAQVVLVAYGMPKQDYWIARNLPHLTAPVAIGVGGVFDYLAGRVPRAPDWMRARGLEWLYRLIRQPSRWPRIVRVWQFAAIFAVTTFCARFRREAA